MKYTPQKNNLERDLDNKNWSVILETNNNIANSIIAKHAPLKRISLNKELKLRAKLSIAKGILISIINKNMKHIESIAEQKTKLEEMNCKSKSQTSKSAKPNIISN